MLHLRATRPNKYLKPASAGLGARSLIATRFGGDMIPQRIGDLLEIEEGGQSFYTRGQGSGALDIRLPMEALLRLLMPSNIGLQPTAAGEMLSHRG